MRIADTVTVFVLDQQTETFSSRCYLCIMRVENMQCGSANGVMSNVPSG